MSLWYAGLLDRRARRIASQVGGSGPRQGLLAGLLLRLVDTYGTTGDRRLVEGVAAALEAWSAILFGAEPLPLLEQALAQDRGVLERPLRSLLEGMEQPRIPAGPVSEAVLSVLLTVECAIRLGGIEAEAAALRAVAVRLGERIEACHGPVQPTSLPGIDAREGTWVERVRELPDSELAEVLEQLEPQESGTRRFVGWTPHALDVEAPAVGFPQAMAALVETDDALGRGAACLRASGGKHLRSRLVLAVAQEIGVDATVSAAAVEWIHLASLAVDDVMDEAPLRRGQPSLHLRTDVPFALSVAGWITAQVLWNTPGTTQHTLVDAIEAMTRGQIAEWGSAGHGSGDLAQIERVMAGKTASLFAAAAELGAPGAPRRVTQGLRSFGEALGLGFQLVDDVLDEQGDPSCLGKATLADRRAGRTTLAQLLPAPQIQERLAAHRRAALSGLEAAFGTAPPALVALLDAALERDR